MLTIRGDSFPNRVAASLLASLDSPANKHNTDLSDVLVADSLMQYEDMAVRIAMSSKRRVGYHHGRPNHDQNQFKNIRKEIEPTNSFSKQLEGEVVVVVDYLKRSLRDAIHSSRGIFCSVCSAVTFIRGMQALYEVDHYAKQRGSDIVKLKSKMHIVLLE